MIFFNKKIRIFSYNTIKKIRIFSYNTVEVDASKKSSSMVATIPAL